MKCSTFLVLGCLLTQTVAAADNDQTGAYGPRIEVHFQNYAGVPDGLLRKASVVAADAYRPAGIAMDWLDCTPILGGRVAPAGCAGEVAGALVIQFVPEKMARAVPVPGSVFGYAPAGTPRQLSKRAVLFWDRIADHCDAFALDVAALLGVALAHEIGHLLLGPSSHRAAGMMSCPWRPQDVASAARGRLNFGSAELEFLREGAKRRLLSAVASTDGP